MTAKPASSGGTHGHKKGIRDESFLFVRRLIMLVLFTFIASLALLLRQETQWSISKDISQLHQEDYSKHTLRINSLASPFSKMIEEDGADDVYFEFKYDRDRIEEGVVTYDKVIHGEHPNTVAYQRPLAPVSLRDHDDNHAIPPPKDAVEQHPPESDESSHSSGSEQDESAEGAHSDGADAKHPIRVADTAVVGDDEPGTYARLSNQTYFRREDPKFDEGHFHAWRSEFRNKTRFWCMSLPGQQKVGKCHHRVNSNNWGGLFSSHNYSIAADINDTDIGWIILYGRSERQCEDYFPGWKRGEQLRWCLGRYLIDEFNAKDRMHFALEELDKSGDYECTTLGSFYPQTYVVNSEEAIVNLKADLHENAVRVQGSWWLIKPIHANGGAGFEIVYDIEQKLDDWIINPPSMEKETNHFVLQKYIRFPFLWKQRKFSLRTWAFIISVDPLVVLFMEGVAYRAMDEYVADRFDFLTHVSNGQDKHPLFRTMYFNGTLGDHKAPQSILFWMKEHFEQYLQETYNVEPGFIDEYLRPKMKEAMAFTLRALIRKPPFEFRNQTETEPPIGVMQHVCFDFVFDVDLNVWMHEINRMCLLDPMGKRYLPPEQLRLKRAMGRHSLRIAEEVYYRQLHGLPVSIARLQTDLGPWEPLVDETDPSWTICGRRLPSQKLWQLRMRTAATGEYKTLKQLEDNGLVRSVNATRPDGPKPRPIQLAVSNTTGNASDTDALHHENHAPMDQERFEEWRTKFRLEGKFFCNGTIEEKVDGNQSTSVAKCGKEYNALPWAAMFPDPYTMATDPDDKSIVFLPFYGSSPSDCEAAFPRFENGKYIRWCLGKAVRDGAESLIGRLVHIYRHRQMGRQFRCYDGLQPFKKQWIIDNPVFVETFASQIIGKWSADDLHMSPWYVLRHSYDLLNAKTMVANITKVVTEDWAEKPLKGLRDKPVLVIQGARAPLLWAGHKISIRGWVLPVTNKPLVGLWHDGLVSIALQPYPKSSWTAPLNEVPTPEAEDPYYLPENLQDVKQDLRVKTYDELEEHLTKRHNLKPGIIKDYLQVQMKKMAILSLSAMLQLPADSDLTDAVSVTQHMCIDFDIQWDIAAFNEYENSNSKGPVPHKALRVTIHDMKWRCPVVPPALVLNKREDNVTGLDASRKHVERMARAFGPVLIELSEEIKFRHSYHYSTSLRHLQTDLRTWEPLVDFYDPKRRPCSDDWELWHKAEIPMTPLPVTPYEEMGVPITGAGSTSAQRSVPPSASKKPAAPSEKPPLPLEKPVVASKKPVVPSKKPVVPSKKPVVPSRKPVVPSEKPAAASKKQVATLPKKQVSPSKKPATPSRKPVTPTRKPASHSKKPVSVPSKKPAPMLNSPHQPSKAAAPVSASRGSVHSPQKETVHTESGTTPKTSSPTHSDAKVPTAATHSESSGTEKKVGVATSGTGSSPADSKPHLNSPNTGSTQRQSPQQQQQVPAVSNPTHESHAAGPVRPNAPAPRHAGPPSNDQKTVTPPSTASGASASSHTSGPTKPNAIDPPRSVPAATQPSTDHGASSTGSAALRGERAKTATAATEITHRATTVPGRTGGSAASGPKEGGSTASTTTKKR